MTVVISEQFAQTQREVHGERGQAWLAHLPALVAQLEAEWHIRVQPPFSKLSYNYAAPAQRASGEPVVLKLGVPNKELTSEVQALELYNGDGIARLYEHDAERGALLLEWLQPGRMLSELDDDDQATEILASLMRRLWRPLPEGHSLPSVASWAQGLGRLRATFGGGTGPFPEALVARAEDTFAELLATAGTPMLLHGDLHHLNVLSAGREPWLAIDPKGLAGDPGYDVAAMLHNPSRTLRDSTNLGALLARRIAIIGDVTGQPRRRLAMWAFAQAVLSAWWTYEDHGHVGDEALYHAELILPLQRS